MDEELLKNSNVVWKVYYPVRGGSAGKCMLWSAGDYGYHLPDSPTFIGNSLQECIEELRIYLQSKGLGV